MEEDDLILFPLDCACVKLPKVRLRRKKAFIVRQERNFGLKSPKGAIEINRRFRVKTTVSNNGEETLP